MANRISIRHGSGTPTTANLVDYELGYSTSNKVLYIRDNNSIIPISATVTNSGSGNAVTAITASNGVLTVTKGSTFLTSADVSGKIDTAGTGLSKSGTTLNHSNSVTAQTTQAIYPIKIDAQGHISAYGSAITSMPASDVYSWAKASSKPTYTASEVGALASNTTYVSTVTTTAGTHTAISSKSGAVSFNVPTKTSHLTNDSGFITSYTDIKLQVAEATSGTTYYPIIGTGTTAATRQYDTTGFVYVGTKGTTSAVGSAKLTLGNSTASGTANNKQGQLVIYGSTAYAHTISGAPTAARTLTLPNATGTIALTGDIPDVSGKIDTAGTGLSKSGTTLNHSNSVTAQTTQAVYPIKIDAQGHISAYGTAIAALAQTDATTGTATASKFITAKVLNDTIIEKAGNVKNFYGTCATAAGTAAKAVTCASFTSSHLSAGNTIAVIFSNTNSAAVADLTLNVNSTGAKPIKRIHNGAYTTVPAVGWIAASQIYTFTYDGTNWIVDLAQNTNTTYSSKEAASGGTDVSLVTTGEKYTWNNKSTLAIGTTSTTAAAGNHTHSTTIAASTGTNQLTLAASTKYAITAGGTSYVFTTPPNTDTKVTISAVNPDDETTYYPLMYTATSGTVAVNAYAYLRHWIKKGTADSVGYDYLGIGNNTATGTVNNSYGALRLYGNGTKYAQIRYDSEANATANTTHYLPSVGGTLLNTGNAKDYVTEQGTAAPHTGAASNGGTWTYRKWSSGLKECWCVASRSVPSGNISAWGSGYETNLETKRYCYFPASNFFTEIPKVFITNAPGSDGFGAKSIAVYGGASVSRTPGYEFIIPGTYTGSRTYKASIYAVGK